MGATRCFNHTGGGVASCDIWQSSSAHLDIFAAGRWENYTTAHFYNTCPCEVQVTSHSLMGRTTSENQDIMCILVTGIQLQRADYTQTTLSRMAKTVTLPALVAPSLLH